MASIYFPVANCEALLDPVSFRELLEIQEECPINGIRNSAEREFSIDLIAPRPLDKWSASYYGNPAHGRHAEIESALEQNSRYGTRNAKRFGASFPDEMSG